MLVILLDALQKILPLASNLPNNDWILNLISNMKLFFSPTSPYVKKVLISAFELNLADQIELLPAKTSPVLRDQSVVAKNPLGKIPTLIVADGRALFDSRVICEYLNDIANGHLFLPWCTHFQQEFIIASNGYGSS